MKKFLLSAVAVLAAVSAKAQGTWYSVSADMSDDPATVVSPKGEETAVATDIQGAAFFITDGAENWECKNAYDPEKVFTATNGKDYPKSYIQGGTNGMGSLNSGEDGNLIPGDYKTAPGLIKDGSTSAHLKIVPTTKGTVYVAAKYGKNKAIWAAKIANEELEDVDFSDLTTYIYNYEGLYIKEDGTYGGTSAAESDTYAALPLEVEEGYTYLFWMAGSKLMLTAIDFVTGATPTPPVYSVIGTLVGGWDVVNDVDMQLVNGLYSATIEIANAGSYEYKIRQDHDWAINWGDNGDGTGVQDGPNFKAELPANSSITITFDPATAKIDAYVVGGAIEPGGEPVIAEIDWTQQEAFNNWCSGENGSTAVVGAEGLEINVPAAGDNYWNPQTVVLNIEGEKVADNPDAPAILAEDGRYQVIIVAKHPAGHLQVNLGTWDDGVSLQKDFDVEEATDFHEIVVDFSEGWPADCFSNVHVLWQSGALPGLSVLKSIQIIDLDATAIKTVKAAKKFEGAIYNLAGQKVNASYKGVVIKDGKKYIQK